MAMCSSQEKVCKDAPGTAPGECGECLVEAIVAAVTPLIVAATRAQCSEEVMALPVDCDLLGPQNNLVLAIHEEDLVALADRWVTE
jgi:hypothetical protein